MLPTAFKNSLKVYAVFFLTLFFSYSVEASAYQANKPNLVDWSVRIHPWNSYKLEVMLDPRKVPCGSSIMDISYDVSFYGSRNRYLGTKSYRFPGRELVDLKHLYRDFPSNAYPNATRVTGGNISYTVKTVGTTALGPANETTASYRAPVYGWPELNQNFDKSLFEGRYSGEWSDTAPDGSQHVGTWTISIDPNGGVSGTEVDRTIRSSANICGFISGQGNIVVSLTYPNGYFTAYGTLSKSRNGFLTGTLYQYDGNQFMGTTSITLRPR